MNAHPYYNTYDPYSFLGYSGLNDTYYANVTYDNTITLASGRNITGKIINGQQVAVYSLDSDISVFDAAGVTDITYNTVNLSSATLNVLGNNILSGVVGWNINSNNTSGGADALATINVNGNNVYFGDEVYANTLSINGGYNNIHLADTLTGNVDFNGNSALLYLDGGNINGNVDTTSSKSGTLMFGTSGTSTVTGSIGSTAALKEIILNGIGTVQVHDTNVAAVNFNAAATLDILSGTFNTTSSASGKIDFNNYAGTINISNGVMVNSNVLSTDGTNGNIASILNTVNFQNNATMNGNIGTSSSRIGEVDIGSGTVIMNGDIYATGVTFLNDGTLSMSSGKNITGPVDTTSNNQGTLTLVGGVQTVSGAVGATDAKLAQVNSGANDANSTFTGNVYAVDVNNTGTGTSNFQGNVVATTINVLTGTSNFAGDANSTTTKITSGTANFASNVNATTTNIGTGTGNFNTLGGTTTSAIAFDGNGTANLHTGLSGTVNFGGNDATVNVWDAKSISGVITTTINNKGILNYLGDGTIASTVGATNMSINELNINTNNDQNTTTSVLASGDIFANTVNLKNSGTLTLANTVDITTTNVTTDNNNTGALNILGTSVINGIVGASDKVIATINAGVNAATTTFNSMVYATTLNYDGNGTVILNGAAGMKGTVDFNNRGGELQIGDNVSLTVGNSGIQFADANTSTLRFNGTSIVSGDVGSSAGTDRFKSIYAGATGETVTFGGNVYVMESTLHVSGTGTVNLQGNLDGGLLYDADGIVNVSNGQSISVVTPNLLAVRTSADSTGTLNYLGSTTLDTYIGEIAKKLKAVTFNSASNNVTQLIDKNIFADTVTIGGASGTTATTVQNVTGLYDYAGGTTMYAWTGGTTANIDGNITLGGNLVIANATTAVNFGKSQVAVSGDMNTTGGAMSFVVNTNDITTSNATSTPTGSAKIIVDGNLNMAGTEKVIVNYLGSLANSGSYTMIDATNGTPLTSYDQNETGFLVKDNSFSIDTRVENTTGDLIVHADRTGGNTYTANQNYIVKSATQGSYSNNAAAILGGIAADGTQTGDMVQVIQKLDIDSFGYGDTQANLAKQVQRLAPVVNNSITLSTMGSSTLALNSVSSRMSELKGTSVASNTSASSSGLSAGDNSLSNGVWAKVIGTAATQDKVGQYDGYKTNSYGMAIGADKKLDSDVIIGLALGYTNSDIDQEDFRSGDTSKVKSYQLMAYASKEFGKAYLEGALAYGMHNTDASRATAIGRIAQASIDANQYSARLAAGYRVDLQNKLTLTPFASFDYAHLVQDAYSETGADALNLNVNEVTTDRSKLGLGLRIGSEWEQNSGKLQADLKLAAYQYLGSDSADVTAQFAGGGAKFVTPGVSSDDTLYNLGLGVKYQISKTTSLGLSLDYDRSVRRSAKFCRDF